MPLSPKSVFITGANRGLGLEFVKQFLRLPTAPKHIFAACRNPDKATDLQELGQQNPNVHVLQLDVTNYPDFPRIASEVGEVVGSDGLNLLINNAGIMNTTSLAEVTADQMMECYKANTIGPVLLAQAFLPLLKRSASLSPGGVLSCSRAAIINLTSKVGSCSDNTSGGRYPYRCSKSALNNATVSMSVDLKAEGIFASVLHPGWVLTAMGGKNALIDSTTSVEGMMNMMQTFSEEHTGSMYDYKGEKILW